jgi:hypothetical protein
MFHSKDGFWIEQSLISGAVEIVDVRILQFASFEAKIFLEVTTYSR